VTSPFWPVKSPFLLVKKHHDITIYRSKSSPQKAARVAAAKTAIAAWDLGGNLTTGATTGRQVLRVKRSKRIDMKGMI